MKKNKYLIFWLQPSAGFRDVKAQINVTGLTKEKIYFEWGKLTGKFFPEEEYLSSLTETKEQLREFNDLEE